MKKASAVALAIAAAVILFCGQVQAIESGLWTTENGQELFIEVDAQNVRILWPTYDLWGKSFCLRAEGTPVSGFHVDAPIYRYSGAPFGWPPENPVIDEDWGDISINFAGDGRATMQYDLNVYYVDWEFYVPLKGQTNLKKR